MNITLACGHVVIAETDVAVGQLVFCPICKSESEAREVHAPRPSQKPPQAREYGTVREGHSPIHILYNENGEFGFSTRVMGVAIEGWGFADPQAALCEARALIGKSTT